MLNFPEIPENFSIEIFGRTWMEWFMRLTIKEYGFVPLLGFGSTLFGEF